ncbi:hypothetical protein SeMB42_g00301 [Synchytrium endobioticum]|uniref:Uncharacterized protein n=1 Tax=Synchytrium endobioticum TaxID=286115 RepID=A0A507DGY5_9FUNG|nr:hypothetical protein SeLEV6574_g00670 [Synchytrium endobioticum]TPX54337.1 hypothetical protein SeMB42_g00301 [Synchytrium endobioticum]
MTQLVSSLDKQTNLSYNLISTSHLHTHNTPDNFVVYIRLKEYSITDIMSNRYQPLPPYHLNPPMNQSYQTSSRQQPVTTYAPQPPMNSYAYHPTAASSRPQYVMARRNSVPNYAPYTVPSNNTNGNPRYIVEGQSPQHHQKLMITAPPNSNNGYPLSPPRSRTSSFSSSSGNRKSSNESLHEGEVVPYPVENGVSYSMPSHNTPHHQPPVNQTPQQPQGLNRNGSTDDEAIREVKVWTDIMNKMALRGYVLQPCINGLFYDGPVQDWRFTRHPQYHAQRRPSLMEPVYAYQPPSVHGHPQHAHQPPISSPLNPVNHHTPIHHPPHSSLQHASSEINAKAYESLQESKIVASSSHGSSTARFDDVTVLDSPPAPSSLASVQHASSESNNKVYESIQESKAGICVSNGPRTARLNGDNLSSIHLPAPCGRANAQHSSSETNLKTPEPIHESNIGTSTTNGSSTTRCDAVTGLNNLSVAAAASSPASPASPAVVTTVSA